MPKGVLSIQMRQPRGQGLDMWCRDGRMGCREHFIASEGILEGYHGAGVQQPTCR